MTASPAAARAWPASGDWAGWAAAWEARMQAFFPKRQECIAAMFEVMAELLPAGPWRLLDLGAGTGSLSRACSNGSPRRPSWRSTSTRS